MPCLGRSWGSMRIGGLPLRYVNYPLVTTDALSFSTISYLPARRSLKVSRNFSCDAGGPKNSWHSLRALASRHLARRWNVTVTPEWPWYSSHTTLPPAQHLAPAQMGHLTDSFIQDVTDTATILQLRDTLSLISTSLDAIIAALRELCVKHKSTPLPARSNLQQAVPISYGFKLARLLATFLRHRSRLQNLLPRLLVVQFSGAAGTLATLPPTEEHPELALDCQKLLAEELGLTVPEISWHTDRDLIAEFSSLLSLLTSTCSKLALDVKLQMQTEVSEVSEPYVPHRGSSSTMPQKRNPISCAYITACNATVRQLSAAIYEDMATEDHERSTGAWEIEWIVLPQISTLSHAAMEHTRKLVDGLEVHEDGMRRNLEISKGGIVSEAVMMALGRKGMGRQKAHDLVYDLCRKAQREGQRLVELLVQDEEVKKLRVERRELEEWCDPGRYLGYSEVMVERVVNMC